MERVENRFSICDPGHSLRFAQPDDFEVAVRKKRIRYFFKRLRGCGSLEIAGRKVLVIGAARSGIASARFLAQRGAIVALNDRRPLGDWPAEALDLKTIGV